MEFPAGPLSSVRFASDCLIKANQASGIASSSPRVISEALLCEGSGLGAHEATRNSQKPMPIPSRPGRKEMGANRSLVLTLNRTYWTADWLDSVPVPGQSAFH